MTDPATPSVLADERTDRVFKALAAKPRREILAILASAGAEDGRCCASDQVCACVFAERLGLGAPTVSHHMKVLAEAGLVEGEKRGTWVYYRLNPGALRGIADTLDALAG